MGNFKTAFKHMAPTSDTLALEPIATSVFDMPEESVATTLGLDRKKVASFRGPEGGRWQHGPNRRVLWSAEGVEAVQAELGGKAVVEKLPDGLQVFVVVKVGMPNARVLLARPENAAADAELLVVYLGFNGDSRRFARGMRILVRHHRGAAWNFEGNPDRPEEGRRLPRFAGRW